MVVIAIMVVVAAFVAPAFTNLKTAGDVTSAAYTIKGVLEQARTYAMANNTYTWVGFYEENVANPASPNSDTPKVGRVVISIVASKDGTIIYDPNATGTNNLIDPTKLTQVTKLAKVDNLHLPLFAAGTGTGETFDKRPILQFDPFGVGYNASRFGELNAPAPNTAPYDTTNSGNTKFPFQYPVGTPAPTAQYTFRKTLQFSPTGECRINSTYDVRTVIEIGLLQTHGTATPVPSSGAGTSTVTFSGNVAAIQVTGVGGDVKIYRR